MGQVSKYHKYIPEHILCFTISHRIHVRTYVRTNLPTTRTNKSKTTCFLNGAQSFLLEKTPFQKGAKTTVQINPFMPSGFFYFNSLDRFISYIKGVWLVFFLLFSCFVEISELNANSVDPDQTPRSAASHLSLRCLPMSHLWGAWLIWVKKQR